MIPYRRFLAGMVVAGSIYYGLVSFSRWPEPLSPAEAAQMEAMGDTLLSLSPGDVVEVSGGVFYAVVDNPSLRDGSEIIKMSTSPSLNPEEINPRIFSNWNRLVRRIYRTSDPEWSRVVRIWFNQ